jgi:hypothetical protein
MLSTKSPVKNKLPLGVSEDYHNLPLTPLFNILGVPVVATPRAWLNAVGIVLPMIIMTVILVPGAGLVERIALTAFWVLLFELTSFTHSIGHIIGGKAAGSPMDKLVVTRSRHVNVYEGDQEQYPPRVHLSRALGGPLANLALALVAGLLLLISGYSPSLFLLFLMNLAFGVGAFAPVPSVDGEVIWRYAFKRAS